MTERWELVELIGQTLQRYNLSASEETVEAVLDSIEGQIRADERGSVKAEYTPVLMEHLRILADLHDRVVTRFASMKPPYLFPHNEDVLFPKMERTTVNDAIRDVWEVAQNQALEVIDGRGQ